MFDIGWSELLLIGIVALIVVGPKELPGLFRTVGRFMGKARGMAREFQRSLEEAADESGLKDAASGLKSLDGINLNSATSSARKYAAAAVTEPKAAAKPAAPAAPTPEAEEPPAVAAGAPEAEKTDGAAGS